MRCPRHFEAAVTDNGKGFEQNGQFSGYGLANMEQRIKEVGGTFKVNSEVGKGTTIAFNCATEK